MSTVTAALEDLVDTLEAADVEVALDPADLNLPGVWVQVTGVAADRLEGRTITTRLVLVVPDTGALRSLEALLELLDKVDTVVPVDTATPLTVALPEGGGPFPGLAVPFDLPL